MQSFIDQQRFVLAVGEQAKRIAEDSSVTVLERLDRVVLIQSSYQKALDLRRTPNVVVHVFERESEARRAFRLFIH